MTFRRYVRTWVMPVSTEVPLDMVQLVVRGDLNAKRHAVIENTWMDHTGIDYQYGTVERRVLVQFVTGGMRHGLDQSITLDPVPGVVEFARPSR